MNRAIYPILSGALAQERQLQVFANNIANVNTAGFKQDQQAFRAIFAGTSASVAPIHPMSLASHRAAVGGPERVFVQPHGLRTSFESGRIRVTGNPLDVALEGAGFFEIHTPTGLRYSRNGMFSLDNQRRLVTNLGYPVMGTTGELRIPPGNVEINPQGTIQVDGRTIGTIKVVDFPESDPPQKLAEGLFDGQAKLVAHPQLRSGHIEESNVNSLGEMVKMIQGMRGYESSQKLLQTLDRMTELAIQDLGRVV